MKFHFFIFFCWINTQVAWGQGMLSSHRYPCFAILAYKAQTQAWAAALLSYDPPLSRQRIFLNAKGGPMLMLEGNTSPTSNHLNESYTWPESIDSISQQLAQVSPEGEVFAHTSQILNFQKPFTQQYKGKHFVVLGNALANENTLARIAQSMEETQEDGFARQILRALKIGFEAEKVPDLLSSATLVIGSFLEDSKEPMDLQTDYTTEPIETLLKLLNAQEGYLYLQEALSLLQIGEESIGKTLLARAKSLIGDQINARNTLIKAYLLTQQEEAAVSLIEQTVASTPSWKRYLPQFHLLIKYPAFARLINEADFSTQDWYEAIRFYLELKRADEAIVYINRLIKSNKEDSYAYYLMGEAYQQKNNLKLAKKSYRKALKLNEENILAKIALERLSGNKNTR